MINHKNGDTFLYVHMCSPYANEDKNILYKTDNDIFLRMMTRTMDTDVMLLVKYVTMRWQ